MAIQHFIQNVRSIQSQCCNTAYTLTTNKPHRRNTPSTSASTDTHITSILAVPWQNLRLSTMSHRAAEPISHIEVDGPGQLRRQRSVLLDANVMADDLVTSAVADCYRALKDG